MGNYDDALAKFPLLLQFLGSNCAATFVPVVLWLESFLWGIDKIMEEEESKNEK